MLVNKWSYEQNDQQCRVNTVLPSEQVRDSVSNGCDPVVNGFIRFVMYSTDENFYEKLNTILNF